MGTKVAINGFGRTGRLAMWAAIERKLDIEFVAVNRGNAKSLGHLLKYDSVHGRAPFNVEVQNDAIILEGKPVKVFFESDPENLPWCDLGVDVVLECSNQFRDRVGASKHLKAGAKKVLIGAPGKNPDLTVVVGVNDSLYEPESHHIVSNASCTTNCVAPVAKILNDSFVIKSGFLSTIHAYTSSQVILDRAVKDLRRSRSAAINIIPTTTGATKALGEVIPELNEKIDGVAFRVPVPDVSLIDLVVNLKDDPSIDEINLKFKKASQGKMKGVLAYSDEPLVSSDYIHSPYSAIYDSLETRIKGNMVKIVAWYDNEYGYCCRLVDFAEKMI